MSKFKSILVYSLVTAFLHNALMAQQKPHYTQYVLNNYILNPALSGIENYTDIKISHRHQWAGLTDAPVTTYLSIQGPLGKKITKRILVLLPCLAKIQEAGIIGKTMNRLSHTTESACN